MKRATGLAMGAGAAFTALSLAVWLRAPAIVWFDQTINLWILTRRDDDTITLARSLTEAGSTFVAFPIIAVLTPLALVNRTARQRLHGTALLIGIAASGAVLGLAINALIAGQRPLQTGWAGAAGGPTYPSGHTTVATILAACLIWVAVERFEHHWTRSLMFAGAVIIALAVGWSRIWLGVHWPTDVLGGWLFGMFWAGVAITGAEQVRRQRDARRQRLMPFDVSPGRR